MTFRVGQRVVCVDDKFTWMRDEGFDLPVVGRVYEIRANVIGIKDGRESPGVLLYEVHNKIHHYGIEYSFHPSRFRPIVEPKTEVSFTAGADPSTDQFDNRRKVKVRA